MASDILRCLCMGTVTHFYPRKPYIINIININSSLNLFRIRHRPNGQEHVMFGILLIVSLIEVHQC